MGKPVLYVRKGRSRTHIFAQAGDWWTAICNSRILVKNTRPGSLREVDCVSCKSIYNPGIHLHN